MCCRIVNCESATKNDFGLQRGRGDSACGVFLEDMLDQLGMGHWECEIGEIER